MERVVYTTREKFFEQNSALNSQLPFAEDTSVLGEEKKIGNHVIRNRLVCQAMEGCDGAADGSPDVLTRRRYDRLAKGGAGIIWYEATAVMEEGRANPRQLYITDDNLDAFKQQVQQIKEAGLRENGFEPLVVMQATHSGRYSKPHGKPAPIIAYNNPVFEKDQPLPSACIATDDYLDRVSEALVNGAVLAEKAGFDGVDMKCCHRYLNSELLSAYTREGKYGGSLENRTRLLRESIQGAMQVTDSDFLVSSRMNIYDGFAYPYGFGVSPQSGLDFDPEEPVWLIRKLHEYGVELLNITMGNPYFNPHVNRPYASGGYEPPEHPLCGVARMLDGIAEVKAQVPQMNIICSGISYLGVAAPNVVAGYIRNGGFDFAGFGRTILAYPDFANDILRKGCMERNKICLCCSKCTQIMRSGSTPGCVIRDRETYLPIYRETISRD